MLFKFSNGSWILNTYEIMKIFLISFKCCSATALMYYGQQCLSCLISVLAN